MKDYLRQLNACFSKIEAKDAQGKRLSVVKAIEKAVFFLTAAGRKGNRVAVIGNGGSAAIASHVAVDLLKNAQIPALAFNDAAVLTCLSNDLGYETVFAKPIELLARKGDVLIAISSSGRSMNILKAVVMAAKMKNTIITLSGFSGNNPLRQLGAINFYVPSSSYGFVELTHSVICHWITDTIMQKRAHG